MTDGLGNVIYLLLSGGEVADISVAPALTEHISNVQVLGDKGYDSSPFVEQLERQVCHAVIPSRRTSKAPRSIDRHVYKERHIVERFFNNIKEFRKVATRYDKLAKVFLAFLHFAAALLWNR